MTKQILDCGQLFKHYILKDIFLYDLKIYEIRLCVFLTSKVKTLSEMTYDEKMWVCGGDPKTYSKLVDAEQHLKELNLINLDGTGYEVKSKHFIQNENIDFYSCKNKRELFVKCAKYWVKKATYISVKKEYIHAVFGEDKRVRNQNIKYTLSKMNINIRFTERTNDYLVEFDVENNKKKKINNKHKQEIEEIPDDVKRILNQIDCEYEDMKLMESQIIELEESTLSSSDNSSSNISSDTGNIDRDMMFIRNIGSKRDNGAPMPMFCTEEELQKHFS